jgi:hypothetical protein
MSSSGKKIFYTDGKSKYGPYSLEELMKLGLSHNTKIWFYGLNSWTKLSEIKEFEFTRQDSNQSEVSNHFSKENKILGRKSYFNKVVLAFILVIFIAIIYLINWRTSDVELYNEIASSSYVGDEDFNVYVDKFYRDISAYNIFPRRPSKLIIKFAKLDQIQDATHIHGISFGVNDDDKIEIYINPNTWKTFNKPKRYFLIYHELSHDILNLSDLDSTEENIGKLMYPSISNYEKISMDEFIESSHALFEEVGNN